jgi:hypothetical protein
MHNPGGTGSIACPVTGAQRDGTSFDDGKAQASSIVEAVVDVLASALGVLRATTSCKHGCPLEPGPSEPV